VTTDEREFARQAAQAERIEAAKRELSERAKRAADKHKAAKREAPAPGATPTIDPPL
jgi:hypothetical protein